MLSVTKKKECKQQPGDIIDTKGVEGNKEPKCII